jgi:DNA-binding transcriptional ArsR family regulator
MPPALRARPPHKARPATADLAFRALADPRRRSILLHLAEHELSAGEVAARFDISRPAVSKHLGVLKRAGLVRERREGREHYYALDHAPLAEVLAWLNALDRFWAEGLQRLGEQLDAEGRS